MPQASFSPDWLKKLSDPYSVLGLSVAADDRRVLKRYRNVAKMLHPDSHTTSDAETKMLASQLFARLVNPAYQKLKQEKERTETLALLRFQVRRLKREGAIAPKTDIARQLLQLPLKDAEIFYEQAIAELAESQYHHLGQFAGVTQQLNELNLVFLHLKMDDPFLREKRTGLVASSVAKPIEFTPVPTNPDKAKEAPVENYAHRHYQRAQEYMKKANWPQAIQELRDAIKIEANRSEYHALLGFAYFKQNLPGMATVYCRQALKLNSQDRIALQYAAKLNIKPESNPSPPVDKDNKKGGLFGLFGVRKR